MQLRTGKTTIQVTLKEPVQVTLQVTLKEPCKIYKSEMQALVNKLHPVSEFSSARVAGFIDLFSYIDEQSEEHKGNPNLKELHSNIHKTAKKILCSFTNSIEEADPYTITLLQKLAPLLISVIMKLK
jgi:hypothetical protein